MFIKLVRIGKDAEVRKTQGGKTVANIPVAYDVGWGDNKKAQWVRLEIWGDRAEKQAPHLTKGKQILAHMDDVHIDVFEGRDGPVPSLKATLVSFEFTAGGKQEAPAGAPSQSGQAAPQQQAPITQPAARDQFDDDIPF